MAFGLNDAAPGVANAMASVAQAIASIQNMKFQRLLMLAQQQREDRLRQEDQTFKMGLTKAEYEKAMDLERLRHANDAEEINLRGMYDVDVANIREGDSAMANAPADLSSFVPIGENTKRLLENNRDKGPDFRLSYKDFSGMWHDAAKMDYEMLQQQGVMARERAVTDRTRESGKRSLENAVTLYNLKNGGQAGAQPKPEKQPTLPQAIQMAQNILQSLAYQLKDAEKAKAAAEALKDKKQREAEVAASVQAIDEINKIKAELNGALASRSYYKIMDAVDPRRKQQGPPAPAGFIQNDTPQEEELPFGAWASPDSSYRYGPSEQIQVPQSWNDVLEMLKKQQGE